MINGSVRMHAGRLPQRTDTRLVRAVRLIQRVALVVVAVGAMLRLHLPSVALGQATFIAAVTFPTNATMMVTGNGFGPAPFLSLPCTWCSTPFFYSSIGVNGFLSWTDTEIQLSGVSEGSGDAVFIAVWNPATGGPAGVWAGNIEPVAPANPQITSVDFSGSGQSLMMTVHGANFGSSPFTNLPFTGDSNVFAFTDWRCTSLFQAGGGSDGVSLNYQSWTPTEIVIVGFGGQYGARECWTVEPGDPYTIYVANTGDSRLATGTYGLVGAGPPLTSPTSTPTATPTPTSRPVTPPSITPMLTFTRTFTPTVSCTPPPCAGGQVLYCPGNCPGGCGMQCVTPTPTVISQTPAISSVQFSGSSGNYTVTITGSGFGDYPGTLPFEGDSSYLSIEDRAQIGHLEWGYSGDANILTYNSWSDTQIQVGGFGAVPGDAVTVTVFNPSTDAAATWGGNAPPVPAAPHITSVQFSGSGANLNIIVSGSGFGNQPAGVPGTGDINFFSFGVKGRRCGISSGLFVAGFARWGQGPTPVTLIYNSWSDTKIEIGGFAGAYGSPCSTGGPAMIVEAGDPYAVTIYNTNDTDDTGPQTAIAGFVVTGPPPTAATSTPTPTISPALAAVTIAVGTAVGAPGAQVPFAVRLSAAGQQVAATENFIAFDSHAPIAATGNGLPGCTVNPDIHKSGTSFKFEPAGCTPGSTCTGIGAIVLALDNNDPIPDGSALYTCRVAIAAGASGSYPLTCSDPSASDPAGNPIPAACPSGTVVIGSACVGDCNGDGMVVVSEIVTLVNIALGNTPLSNCTAGDANGDGTIEINELVQAVDNALNGCSH